MECGMKWTPTMPFEVAPQMKKLPDKSQKTGLCMARENAPRPGPSATAVPSSGARLSCAAGTPCSPRGRRPTLLGSSRMSKSTGTKTASAARARVTPPFSRSAPISKICASTPPFTDQPAGFHLVWTKPDGLRIPRREGRGHPSEPYYRSGRRHVFLCPRSVDLTLVLRV
jgi:hypothetical protein